MILVRQDNRHQIGIREIAVIIRILLDAHRIGLILLRIVAARLLQKLVSGLCLVDLPRLFRVDRRADILEAVQILDLGARIELRVADRPHREIDVAAHRAHFHLAVGNAAPAHQLAQALQICLRLCRRADIRLRDDLDQRNAAAVAVCAGAVVGMHQLAGILLDVDARNADALLLAVDIDVDVAVLTERMIELRDLVCLRQIGIEIVLSVHFREMCDLAVEHHARARRKFDDLLVEHRQCTRHTHADRTAARIRLAAVIGGAVAEYFGLGTQLDVYLKTDD